MTLIATFAVLAFFGQALNVMLALLIERHTSAFTSIITFFVGMLVVIWITWRLTLWLTKPGLIGRLLHREKPSDTAQAGH
jgi:hypothetical protein